MSASERVQWDKYYRQQGTRYFPPPDPILFEYVAPLFEVRTYRALDLACGYGQNALWLAAQGYVTDAIDISRVALAVGQLKATERTLPNINLLPLDLDEVTLEPDTYDVVCVARFLKRRLMPQIRASVRSGGRIIYMTYNENSQMTDFAPFDFEQPTARVGELVGFFADWRILIHDTHDAISTIVAVKPEDSSD